MTETPAEEPTAPAAAQPAPEPAAATPAPAPVPVQRVEFYRSRPFQVGLAAIAGLAIGGAGGLAIGFAAGHHFGGDRHRQHGFYQDGPRRDRMPMLPPRKVNPQKPLPQLPAKPTNPAPTASPTA